MSYVYDDVTYEYDDVTYEYDDVTYVYDDVISAVVKMVVKSGRVRNNVDSESSDEVSIHMSHHHAHMSHHHSIYVTSSYNVDSDSSDEVMTYAP